MTRNVLMYATLKCPKDTLSTDFSQWKWNMLYGFIVGSLIYSIIYKLICKFDPYMFWGQGCRSLKQKTFNGLQGFKEGLIWYLERFTKHKLGWF